MASRRVLSSSLVAFALALSSVASADPGAADKETARGLMTEGRADRDKGDLKAALKAFAGADAIMHVPTTGLEVAKTQSALGLLVEARDTALRIMRSAPTPNEPPPFKQARDAATALNDEIESRIPSVTVTLKNVPDGATPSVTIDDAPVPTAVLGQPRKVNPGHHVIVAKAGGADARQEVDVAEKEQKDVAIELPPPSANATGPGDTTGGTGDATAADQPETRGKSGFSKTLLIGGFSLAGAGVIAGTVTGILSMSKTNSIKSSPNCQGSGSIVCGPAENSDISTAKSMATVSTVSFIVAGVGAGAAIVDLIFRPKTGGSRVGLVPEIGAGWVGAHGSF
jgi:hypothetical protein